MSSGSSASTEIIESRDQMNSSNGNSCGPTVLETKLTLRSNSHRKSASQNLRIYLLQPRQMILSFHFLKNFVKSCAASPN